jgi:hypothetical protein
MTHPGSGQPTRIKLPLTKPNQNWCTIRVNTPERRVTCPNSNVSLSVKTLKETTVLAEKGKTVVRIPVANQGEDQNFGVYAIPGLGTHAFVGPFTSKQEEHSGGDDSFVGHCSETKEFDENNDESEPSCTQICPMPCRQHGTDSSTSDDSDVTPLVTPTTGTKRWEGITYKEARPVIANKVASRIREYFSLLNNPNDAGNYDWHGETLSKAEIEKRIEKLGLSAWN